MQKNKINIGITMGDPRGIGAEIIAQAVPKLTKKYNIVLFGDPVILKRACRLYRKPPAWIKKSCRPVTKIQIHPKKLGAAACGNASIKYIREAFNAYERGEIDAIVTAPISKEHARASGFKFPGHTEFLANLTKTKKFVMMLAGEKLRVALVTIHEPLSNVPRLITKAKIIDTIKITNHSLKRFFGIKRPRIAVAGLNPHAGEKGMFGKEERTKIIPAIATAKRARINAIGPLAPDTVFTKAVGREFDAVVSMYHDQGLIPLKLLHFKDGVNITLGLPIIRTSVDHGTAFDIAWKGKADPASLIAAVETAGRMVKHADKVRN